MQDKREFGKRLRAAMEAAGLEPRAKVIEHEMALRGVTVRHQTAWNWLSGISEPRPSYLRHLAEMVRLAPHELRDGLEPVRRVEERRRRWDEMSYADAEVVDAFLKLTAVHKRTVGEVILTFAKVHRGAPSGVEPQDGV